MTDQEQAPLDLAAIEQELHDALDDRQYARWAKFRGWALVTALKARDERYQELLELARRESTWRDAIDEVLQLRDDLARVEAERNQYLDALSKATIKLGELSMAQARIAELEGSLRPYIEQHCEVWADGEMGFEACTFCDAPQRPISSALIDVDPFPHEPGCHYLRARAALAKPQTPSAS